MIEKLGVELGCKICGGGGVAVTVVVVVLAGGQA